MGHVVDVLDENNVGVDVAEIAYERTVTAWAEDEVTILIACGLAVEGKSRNVGCRWLDAVGDIDIATLLLEHGSKCFAEGWFHAYGNGIVDMALAVGEAVCFGLGEVLFGGCADGAVGVLVEGYEAFGVAAVCETVLAKDE